MKKLILLVIISLFTVSCTSNDTSIPKVTQDSLKTSKNKPRKVLVVKVIKDFKETHDIVTDYKYVLNPLGRDLFKKVPNVYSVDKYYLIYTDHTIDEVSKNSYLAYSKGDTVKYNKFIYN